MSTTAPVFSLQAIVREVLDTSALTDPGAIAKEVSERVPDEHLRDAFDEMLRSYVLNTMTGRRRLVPPPAVLHETPAPRGRAGRPAKGAGKVSGIREAWRAVLRQRISVGPAAADWKFLADCTGGDLEFAEMARREHAAQTIANADQLKGLRELMTAHGAKHVRDVPDSALAEYFGGAK